MTRGPASYYLRAYQACNWLYIGKGTGHGPTRRNWITSEGKEVTSRTLRHRGMKVADALRAGWRPLSRPAKHKFVHFEGGDRRERAVLKAMLRYPVLPYLRRA